jgi:ubiquitin-like protein Pup
MQEKRHLSKEAATDKEAVAEHLGQTATDPAAQEHKEQLDEDIDAILDEIDDVLEENAEDFVRGFIQKGGQ